MKNTIQYIKETLADFYESSEIESFISLIFSTVFGYSKKDLILNSNQIIPEIDLQKIKGIISRLENFEPIQYILGKTEFYGLPLFVETGVLIPRFETEELVNLIIKNESGRGKIKILDIGTGSGCIAIALKKNFPEAEVWCCDISDKAILAASRNSKLNEVEINIEKFDIIGTKLFKQVGFDIIVSNPPYVTCKEKVLMHRNVLDYEPALALFVPDSDPLLFYSAIISKSRDMLLPGGKIYFEINETFGIETRQLLLNNGLNAEIVKDINGKDRFIRSL